MPGPLLQISPFTPSTRQSNSMVNAGIHCYWEGRKEVIAQDVVAAVSQVTSIPKDIIFRQPNWTPETWESVLQRRVRGQEAAIREVTRRLLLNLGPLREDPRKPLGVFLFVGPTGVGKTELAKALTELLFADESRMVRLNMSDFKGLAGVQRLIGPPRGIVGAGRGELTEKIRHQPYTVLLLDEFDRCDEEIQALFLSVFDEGWLADGLGRKVYFNDTIIILTSNLGQAEYRRLFREIDLTNPTRQPSQDEIRKAFMKAVARLPPELLNRISAICVFMPLGRETLLEIAKLLLDHLKERVYQRTGKFFTYDEQVVELLVAQECDPQSGARGLRRALERLEAYELNPCLHKGNQFHLRVGDGETFGQQKLEVVVETNHEPATLQ